MTKIESIVNSRPLTSINDNTDDYEALMPNHFCRDDDPITFQLLTRES